MLSVIFLYLCFTATTFLGSLVLKTNHYPYFVAGARFFGSGCMLLVFYFLKHKKSIFKQLNVLCSLSFFLYSFCLYTFSAIGFSWGMQYVDPVIACFVFVLAPFITAILLYFLKHERLSNKKLVGLFIGFFAVIPIILESGHGYTVDVTWYDSILGYIAFGLAIISFSYGWILNKEMHNNIHLPSLLVTGTALVVGGGITLLGCFILQGASLFAMQVTDDFWWLLLLLTIITAVAYNLYALLLKKFSTTFISFASFLEPAFGLLYAAVFLEQPITNLSVFSLIVLGFSLYIFYQEELQF